MRGGESGPGPTWPPPPGSPGPSRTRPRKLHREQTPGAGRPASAPGPPSPARHGGRPASPQLRGRRVAGLCGPCCLTLSPRAPGVRAAVGRMSPWSWFLLPTLCLLPTSAAPQRGALASANCELKPQVRRASRAGEAVFPHLARVFPKPRSTARSDPEPPLPAAPSCWLPLSGGGAAPGRMRLCPQPSPLGRAAKESPGGVSWVSPAGFAGFRGRRSDESSKTERCRDLAH